jgi:hypothetical protein
MSFRLIAAALFALAAALPARAFTPENGFWWNPAEPGTGYNIEIQDNFLAMTAYVFAADGRPQWYTATGTLAGNARYTGQLDGFVNGQCIGCPFRAPTAQLGAGGSVSIEFTTETRATLTLGGRTIPIQRFDFYLTRGQGDPKTELMLGEWAVLIDFHDRDGQYEDYPYYGDLLIFDALDRSETPDYFVGCRPTNSESGRCTEVAIDDHDAAGFFNSGSGEHVIVVKDTPGTAFTDAIYFAYFVELGTYQFDGVVEVYDEDETPGNGPYYPVRGFRTASRNFVQNGTGPSQDAKAAAERAPRGLGEQHALLGRGMTADEVLAKYGFDPSQRAADVERLTKRLAD